MEIIDTTKSLLENLYYLSGILILISIFVGIWQLIQAKETLKITSHREAGILAANQVKYYQKVIIPLVNKFDKQIEKINCPKYEGEIKTFSRDDLFEDRTWLKSWGECVSKNNPDIQVLNSLEAFATYFMSKMANEKIAFYATGETFCRTVEKLFPFIAINITLDHQYYINIRDLYQIWSKRIKKEKLQNQVKERLSKIDEIEEKK